MARMGEGGGVHRVLVGKPEGKRPLGRPRRRWEDNIKMDLHEVGGAIRSYTEWVINVTLRPLYLRERPGTHCIGGWVGPRTGLDRCERSRPHRNSISGHSSP